MSFQSIITLFCIMFRLRDGALTSSSIQWMDVSDLEMCAESRTACDRVDY